MTNVAIDLGATCLRVAYLGSRGPRVLLEADGADAVPAVVWLAGPADARVGVAAAGGHPGEMVTSVRADLLADPRAIARDRYFHGHFESPESVAGYLLADAARRAGVAAGTPVRDVTLGVPTAADDSSGLRRAASAAGLTVADTIAEPVAVALHYGAVRDGVDHVTVVHDLGGTTLDVAVLRIRGRDVAILRSARDMIGGARWDEALASSLLAGGGGQMPDTGSLAAAEQLRIRLTDSEQASGRLTGPGTEREVHVDRARLEELTAHLLDRVIDFTRQTIEEAVGASGERPDSILLAGGASRMPMVARALAARLGLNVRADDPQLAVVRGLALARDFGLLFVTGQEGEPLSLPPVLPARPPSSAPPQVPVTGGHQAVDEEPAAVGRQSEVEDPEPRLADPEPAAAGPLAADPGPLAADPEPLAADPGPLAADHGPVAADPEPLAADATPRFAGTEAAAPTRTAGRPAGLADAAPRRPPSPRRPLRPPPPAADPPRPPGVVPVGGAPEAERLSGRPVGQLRALRQGERVLLTWIWPEDCVEAQVRWRSDEDRPGVHGSARCSRRMYDHDGGFQLPAGRSGLMITVEALGYGDRLDGEPASAVLVPPSRPAIRYDPVVQKKRRSWVVTLTFTGDIDCSLPPVLVVLGTSSYMPTSTRDGEVVHTVSQRSLSIGLPSSDTFELAPQRGPRWLVCLPADDDSAPEVDLRPASLHRLRVN